MDLKKKRKLVVQVLFLCFLIAGTVFVVRQQRDTPYQHDTGLVFGTIYHITYQSDENLNTQILAELGKVDDALSMFNKGSVISRINRNEPARADGMFASVFNLAEKVSADTGGAFDITVAPLVNAWGFGFKNGRMPSAAQIDSMRQFVGYRKVRIEDEKVVKTDPRIMLDCSAIAKGYGSDVVARFLESRGIDNYMVEIGGEIVTRGISEKRLPWKIGVTKPTDDSLSTNEELQTVLNVTNVAMATSGNYRKFYYKGGKKYAHTIDPHTGRPVQHSLLSATVLAPDCATADAYATAFMVMGMEKAKAVLARNPSLMAYFIYDGPDGKYKVWYSPSMKGKVVR